MYNSDINMSIPSSKPRLLGERGIPSHWTRVSGRAQMVCLLRLSCSVPWDLRHVFCRRRFYCVDLQDSFPESDDVLWISLTDVPVVRRQFRDRCCCDSVGSVVSLSS